MNGWARLAAAAALLAMLVPEWQAYRAEHALARVEARVDEVLTGRSGGTAAIAAIDAAIADADLARAVLPDDPRSALAAALPRIMRGRAGEARAILEAAIAAGERPELTLNLGRALAAEGDDDAAQAAFLRAAWASPTITATLPRATREAIGVAVAEREAALRAGKLSAIPPLPAAQGR
jgi:tetratricopeptide (TPR) repeat protein